MSNKNHKTFKKEEENFYDKYVLINDSIDFYRNESKKLIKINAIINKNYNKICNKYPSLKNVNLENCDFVFDKPNVDEIKINNLKRSLSIYNSNARIILKKLDNDLITLNNLEKEKKEKGYLKEYEQ